MNKNKSHCIVCKTRLNKKYKTNKETINFKNKNNSWAIAIFLNIPNNQNVNVCDVCNHLETLMRWNNKESGYGIITKCLPQGFENNIPKNYESISKIRQKNINKFIYELAIEYCESENK